eukprot:2873372-Prymnesium_polylepis.1
MASCQTRTSNTPNIRTPCYTCFLESTLGKHPRNVPISQSTLRDNSLTQRGIMALASGARMARVGR